jgi:peptidoglycan lytic transglycosylase
MIRQTVIQKTVLAVLAALLCAGTFALDAPADTGGVIATQPKTAHATSIATWFGPGFYGNKTACGQTLTPDIVGVANRTLACGTLVRISYRGRRLTVPVIDRGPYSHIGADWDLTAEAARTLGVEETVRIRTRIVGITANTPTLGLPPAPPASILAGGAAAG